MEKLKHRRALVTGAGKRLGRAMALALGKMGVEVVAHYNQSADDAASLVAEIGNGTTVQGDLSLPSGGETLFREAVDAAGPIDILINNASVFPASTLMDFTDDALATNVSIHAFAPLQLSRALFLQGGPGVILNMIDTRIKEYDSKHAAYHLSKRMLFTITRMTAMEFAPSVRVNAIAPGPVLPPVGKDLSYFEEIRHTNPLHSYGCEEDITRTMQFLLESPFITGQTVFVDGGYHMKGSMYGT